MRSCAFLGLVSVLVLAAAGPVAAGEGAGMVVLNVGGYWRCRYAGGTDIVRTEDGKLVPVHPSKPRERIRKTVDG